MRGLLGVLVAAGTLAGASMVATTSAEAGLFHRGGGCCTVAKRVHYRQPVEKLVPRVTYERVRSYRTVWVKKAFTDRCGCRKFYRNVAVQKPTVSVVKRVTYERVRSYRTVSTVKHYRKRCCCN